MTTLTLDTLIANAEKAIPNLGSRAQKAAELVTHHEALFLGNLFGALEIRVADGSDFHIRGGLIGRYMPVHSDGAGADNRSS